jgi:hypothetical protein
MFYTFTLKSFLTGGHPATGHTPKLSPLYKLSDPQMFLTLLHYPEQPRHPQWMHSTIRPWKWQTQFHFSHILLWCPLLTTQWQQRILFPGYNPAFTFLWMHGPQLSLTSVIVAVMSVKNISEGVSSSNHGVHHDVIIRKLIDYILTYVRNQNHRTGNFECIVLFFQKVTT